MANRAKAKGTSFETSIVRYLESRGLDARRKALAGAADEGDIDVGPPGRGKGWTLEAKNVQAISLAAWVDEAAAESRNSGRPVAVVAKRRGKGSPGEAYVVMSFDAFIDAVLLSGSLDAPRPDSVVE